MFERKSIKLTGDPRQNLKGFEGETIQLIEAYPTYTLIFFESGRTLEIKNKYGAESEISERVYLDNL